MRANSLRRRPPTIKQATAVAKLLAYSLSAVYRIIRLFDLLK